MQHLLIDITFLTNELKRKRPPHGIPRVVLAYLDHYLDRMKVLYRIRGRIFIFPVKISQQIAHLLLEWDFKQYKKILKLILQGIVSAEAINPQDTYYLIKLDQNGMKYPAYFNSIKQAGINLLVVIHDIFPVVHPEYSDPNYAVQFEENLKLCVKNARGLICVSESTHNVLHHYLKSINYQIPPVAIASLAPGLSIQELKGQRLIEGPYFVMLSTIVTRKNHLMLLYIWRELVAKWGEKTPKLVIIGKRSSECSSTLSMLDNCRQLQGIVIETQVSDTELADYLSHATALLFPTFAEGYGLPLIEALSNNVPVIASNLSIFKEFAHDIPDYLEPIDGKGWMEFIEAYAEENSEVRQAQLKRLEQFSIPTWQQHFDKVDLFIKRLSESQLKNQLVHS